MDTISITEALVSELVDQDGVDGTNAVQALRRAQAHVMEYTGSDNRAVLDNQRTVDEVDDILIMVSQNGRFNYFIH